MKTMATIGSLTTLALLLGSGVAKAANVEIEWHTPGQWRDIRAVDTNQQRYLERVMDELGEQFRKDAGKLPSDQTLHIAVRDVDLAGEIEYFYSRYPFGLRVIRNVDAPALELRYELRDADDRVIRSGEQKLKDPGFKYTTLAGYDRNTPFPYERALIHDWYQSEF